MSRRSAYVRTFGRSSPVTPPPFSVSPCIGIKSRFSIILRWTILSRGPDAPICYLGELTLPWYAVSHSTAPRVSSPPQPARLVVSFDRVVLQHRLELGTHDPLRVPPPRSGDVARLRVQPGAHAGPRPPGHPAKGLHRSALPGALSFGLCHVRCASAQGSGAGRWQPDRLLLRGLWPDRVPAGVFGRPRDPLRRPLEVFQRPGLSANRAGTALPARLFPPIPKSRRMAAGTLSDERLLHAADGNRESRR